MISFEQRLEIDSLPKINRLEIWKNILVRHIKNVNNDGRFSYMLNSTDLSVNKYINIKKDLLENMKIEDIGILYEYYISQKDSLDKKTKGQFYTPSDAAKFMASLAKNMDKGKWLDPSSGKGKWLDPSSGIGNLSFYLAKTFVEPEKFIKNNLIVSDIDDVALLIARVIFTLEFQNQDKMLFLSLKENFLKFDFLRKKINDIPKHDFVIVNPPYLQVKSNEKFETKRSRDLYSFFLENVIKTSKGFISITPQSFTNSSKFRELRGMLIDNFEKIDIFSFDNVPDSIFKGYKFGSTNTNVSNSVRASITFAKKDYKKMRRSTPLLRWKRTDREKLFKNLNGFLTKTEFTVNNFPKIGLETEELLNKLNNESTLKLSSIISDEETKYVLFLPSTPRYFISALKTPVSRKSIKKIYFKNKNDFERAYILLNSSLTYWWWRVFDGGMTISNETIKTVPLIDFKIKKEVLKDLEKSELINKVYKRNAGSIQENVKHSFELINKIDNSILDKETSRKIQKFRKNSYI